MPAPITLTIEDIQEMISSVLLAEMDFQKRLNHTSGGRLDADFIPAAATVGKPEKTIARIARQFGLKNAQLITGLTVRDMAEQIISETGGRPEILTFFTSGSTGEPVPAPSAFADLEQEVHALAKLFPDRKKIISLVPRHHIYGFLFSILLPKALDIPVSCKAVLPSTDLIDNLKSGDLIIAFPLLWSKLETLELDFPANVCGVTSTGPCPAAVINSLRAKGLTRMTEVYGSSETGGVGYRHNPADFYTLMDHWKKLGNQSLIRSSSKKSEPVIYELQDSFKWQNSNHFTPLRRRDKAVQVAGINIYPSKVENFFNSLPQVESCSVRLMTHGEGDRLKIFIVPASDFNPAALESELRGAASLSLTPHEQPKAYTFGSALPASGMGKLTDW
ncbi:AMP-binding protein [Maridesulfovibrio hydrothermalis]|uniref:4-coumarate--CoA ligase n=1 Tax=Maridesulfovibrio hydrothermalis AM13 = DSM 14728 TaxID=1121451 RepID=L0RB34_9BACT|nr:AMP-binding protein [Maridesulfovibrio hydrothermalis]CCO23417.1 4-coumarate--CoA ligase [Maridesulfovibrio hydrothermalis AM13 = DSM 14728]